MEGELGFKLFERDARDVTLTDDGAKFVEGARDLVLRYKALIHSLNAAPPMRASVRIGLPSCVVAVLIPHIASTLRNRYSEVSFSVVTDTGGGIRQKLKADLIDIGFVALTDKTEDFHVEKLCTLGMRWVGSPALLRHSDGNVLTPEDIARYPIISSQPGTFLDRCIVEYIDGHGQEGLIVHRSDDQTTTVGMALAGIGVTILPEVLIQREIGEGASRLLNVAPPLRSSTYAAIYAKGTTRYLPQLVASIACDAPSAFCGLYDDSIAYRG